MKCKDCRYNDKQKFENTTMTTCNVKLYLIKQLNKEGWSIYYTDALVSQDDDCYLIKTIKIYLKNKYKSEWENH